VFILTALLTTGWLTAGCGGGGGGGQKTTVTGTVTYLQRITLPPEAEVYVALQDISTPDRPARTVARQTIATRGKQVPIPFALECDLDLIDEARAYSLHAEIRVGGKRQYVSAQSYPVLTRGAPTQADIVVMAVREDAPANASLVGTYWKLVELGGEAVVAGTTGAEPHLTLLEENHRSVATGGCNQMSADYQLSGASLTFGPFISTQRACSDGMERDQALAQALESTASHRIDGGRLEILNASGAVLARFDAAANEE